MPTPDQVAALQDLLQTCSFYILILGVVGTACYLAIQHAPTLVSHITDGITTAISSWQSLSVTFAKLVDFVREKEQTAEKKLDEISKNLDGVKDGLDSVRKDVAGINDRLNSIVA